MDKWWHWWLKWWVLVAITIFILIIFSEPPRLWFWLVLFVVVMVYGLERAINS